VRDIPAEHLKLTHRTP